jgi:ABC-type branched-subunit amino acid transport system ATPase component
VDGTILKVTGVTKNFKGLRALDGVSFSVRKGMIKGLIGPNGAGKTTLLNIVNGITKPDSGKILFNEKDITGLRADNISRLGIGRTFQIVRLFSAGGLSVIDNVLIGAHSVLNPRILDPIFFRKRLLKKEAEMREKASLLLSFVGLKGMEGRPINSLSFGSQRLVELARALMSDPEIILLDEPASGLNDFEVGHLKEIIISLREKGMTVLIVEHNIKLVMEISHEVVVLNFGKKIAEGTPSDVISDKDVLEAYLGSKEKWMKV